MTKFLFKGILVKTGEEISGQVLANNELAGKAALKSRGVRVYSIWKEGEEELAGEPGSGIVPQDSTGTDNDSASKANPESHGVSAKSDANARKGYRSSLILGLLGYGIWLMIFLIPMLLSLFVPSVSSGQSAGPGVFSLEGFGTFLGEGIFALLTMLLVVVLVFGCAGFGSFVMFTIGFSRTVSRIGSNPTPAGWFSLALNGIGLVAIIIMLAALLYQ
jgi:hypothetical protein